MLRDDHQGDFTHRRGHRVRLLDFVAAVAVVLDHLANATYLTLDSR